MATSVLEARGRAGTGRSGARTSRREGFIPAVVYGPRIETQTIEVAIRDFDRLVRAGELAGLVELRLGEGDPTMVLIKEIQRQPVTKDPVHVDFHAVIMDQDVQVTVTIEFVGEPKGVTEGGVTQFLYREVDVTCLPLNIPSGLTIDISGVGLNETLLVGDLPLPEGVALATDPEETLLTVTVPTIIEEPTDEEELEGEEGVEAGEEGEAGEAEGEAGDTAEPSGDDE